jgi:hypothetical protein
VPNAKKRPMALTINRTMPHVVAVCGGPTEFSTIIQEVAAYMTAPLKPDFRVHYASRPRPATDLRHFSGCPLRFASVLRCRFVSRLHEGIYTDRIARNSNTNNLTESFRDTDLTADLVMQA